MNGPVMNILRIFFLSLLVSNATVVNAVDLPDFTRLVEQYSPAVVNISTTQKIISNRRPRFNFPDSPDYHQFGELFRRFFEQQPDYFNAQSLGSGTIVSEDGYILTNAHVIENADEILVRLYDRRELKAGVIGVDKQSDLALLKIDAKGLPTVKLGSSKDLKPGAWVMAIGNPFGFNHTVTAGIVSAKGRNFQGENYVPFIQTDVAINPGNSGGPLFNTRGEVVGINSRITSGLGQRSYIGLSFAIPVEVVKNVMAQLKATGFVSRGWLGVLIQDVTPELSKSFGLDRPQGALVAKVLDNGPAKSGGIQIGDVILKFNGEDVATSAELPPLVGSVQAGKEVKLVLLRQGKRKILTMKVGELPGKVDWTGSSGYRQDKGSWTGKLGLRVKNLDQKTMEETGARHGVLVTEIESGSAESFGLSVGDIIQMVGDRTVLNVAEFKSAIKKLKPGGVVAILVYRQSGPVFLAIRIPGR